MLTALLWIGAIIGGLIVLYLAYTLVRTMIAGAQGRTPAGLTATAQAPPRAVVGEIVRIPVVVANSLDRPRTVTNVDMEDALRRGFDVVSIDPAPVSASDRPRLGIWVYSHKLPIGPAGKATVTFTLRAARPGTHAGHITAYVDGDHYRCIECPVRIEVSADG